ncbi:MAG: ATP-binding protein [Acidobacteriota bacterium]
MRTVEKVAFAFAEARSASGKERLKSQGGTNRVATRTLLLLFIAVLAIIASGFNLRDRWVQKPVPTDGVTWEDVAGVGVVAARVESGSPASRSSLRRGDVLIGISLTGSEPFEEVTRAQHVQIYLDQAKDRLKDGFALSYWIVRRNDAGDTVIHEGIADLENLAFRSTHLGRGLYLWLIGLIYLTIGIYVLLKQGKAPYVAHFFLICLLAFIAHSFSATEELRTQFDKVIDLTETIALILLTPLFIHFAAIYPARYHLFNRRRSLAMLLYVPAIGLIVVEVALHFGAIRNWIPWSAVNLKSAMERIEVAAFGASMIISCALLLRTFWGARSLIVRQQLKWVVWGMGIAGGAFAAFYLPSFLASSEVSGLLESLAIAPFIFIPLTLGYSIVRYRLMDVDVVVRRSAAYFIATLSVAVLFGSVMAGSYEVLRGLLSEQATVLIAAVVMSAIAMLFAPMKNWVQERIDRFFYGEKYDYRVTLQDFGRALSSTTELDVLLDRLVRRLKEVLAVERLAIFIEDRSRTSGFSLARTEGIDREISLPADFLVFLREQSGSTGIVRADALDSSESGDEDSGGTTSISRHFGYFVPCAVRSRMVAVIALGRGSGGALLSSEDSALLRSISGYVAVAVENALLIEEQEHRAKELERLKEFNENIIESINVGVMVINPHGRIVNWNSALEAMYGLRRDEAIGRRIIEVFDAGMIKALREMMARSDGLTNAPINVYKFKAAASDGRELILNLSLAALQDKTGAVEGTLIAIEDLTDRVRLEEQLQQSDKLSSIGILAAGVAHEVNTPLTGISSYAQMLLQQIPENDPRHQLLQKIHRQTSRASAIVNNLLNFSRVSDARLVPVDLHRVLDDTVQLLDAQLRNTDIEVIRAYSENLPLVAGNAPKLQQVFMNIILNARDAMTRGGRLEILTDTRENSVIVRFRDSGSGISPEHLSKIYDPFFTTKQIGSGTGLGLAVSYGIIQDHGGRIAVDSRPGDGACFEITLPIAGVRQLATASD